MQNGFVEGRSGIEKLRAEWGRAGMLAIAFLGGGFWLLQTQWNPTNALLWLAIAGGVAVYQFVFLWQHLEDNRGPDGHLYASLGPANRITIARAVLTGALAGFLPGGWPQGWLAWAPGILYLLVAILDFVDGFAARITRRVTRLGELLDMQWDGAGVLVGAALAARYGQAPAWYLLVALARFLFVAGEWLLKRRGLPLYALDPSMIRRALAGMQMGFIGVVLLPVFTPPATQVAATLFMLPFMLHFVRDFLVVGGFLRPRGTAQGTGPRAWLPLGLRGLQILLLALVLVHQAGSGFAQPWLAVVAALALPAILIGAAGRVVALAVLLMSGFALQSEPVQQVQALSALYWAILLTSTLLFVTGTGRFSLWKPEDWLIYHRAGEV